MKTNRFCEKCGTRVRVETVIRNYPYYCPVCQENLFRFETVHVRELKRQKKKLPVNKGTN